VNLVQVNRFDIQATETVVAGRNEVLLARVVGRGRANAALGGQHHAIPQLGVSGQNRTQQLFVSPETGAAPIEAVHVSGVNQIHARVQSGLQHGAGLLKVFGGEPPTAKSQRPDLERSESAGTNINQRIH